jgi:hypothetical protein
MSSTTARRTVDTAYTRPWRGQSKAQAQHLCLGLFLQILTSFTDVTVSRR